MNDGFFAEVHLVFASLGEPAGLEPSLPVTLTEARVAFGHGDLDGAGETGPVPSAGVTETVGLFAAWAGAAAVAVPPRRPPSRCTRSVRRRPVPRRAPRAARAGTTSPTAVRAGSLGARRPRQAFPDVHLFRLHPAPRGCAAPPHTRAGP